MSPNQPSTASDLPHIDELAKMFTCSVRIFFMKFTVCFTKHVSYLYFVGGTYADFIHFVRFV